MTQKALAQAGSAESQTLAEGARFSPVATWLPAVSLHTGLVPSLLPEGRSSSEMKGG